MQTDSSFFGGVERTQVADSLALTEKFWTKITFLAEVEIAVSPSLGHQPK